MNVVCPHDLAGSDRDTATYCPEAVSLDSVVVLASTPEGHEAAMVLSLPLTPESVRRLAELSAMPGLADATWTATPGTSPR